MGWHFYPRTPCGVRRIQPNQWYKAYGISIHVPRAGYDPEQLIACDRPGHFYPRTPCGVRPTRFAPIFRLLYISIHVPRAGYDPRRPDACKPGQDISIHVPRAGYDEVVNDYGAATQAFLSTYPVRGTTLDIRLSLALEGFLSTYPVRGTTCGLVVLVRWTCYFYPRTPCGVRPQTGCSSWHTSAYFYPRTPCGVRQAAQPLTTHIHSISIHVPRAGYDLAFPYAETSVEHISIHVPRAGYDDSRQCRSDYHLIFLSTYPVRGTTTSPP